MAILFRTSGVRGPLGTGAVVVTAALGLSLVGTASGHSEPTPTVASVRARIAALDSRLDRAVERYDRARVDLAAAQRRAAAARRRTEAAQRRLAQLRVAVSAVAATVYRDGRLGTLGSLVGATGPQQFVDRVSTLAEIGHTQLATIRNVSAAERELAIAGGAARSDAAAARSLAADVVARRAAIVRALAVQRRLLGRLEARQRARMAAARQAQLATQLGLRAAGASPGSLSGVAGVAVGWAYRELGKPYLWGAAGPDAFDCSGLTSYVWARAGVSLPHSSAAQYAVLPHVDSAALRPGDLVFFGSPISHVGIYVGGGAMIEAPHTGGVVQLVSADRPDYAGAARP